MALRAGSVGLGREAGLGARRGWTRRRRPLPRPGRPLPLPRGSALPSSPRGPVVPSRSGVWGGVPSVPAGGPPLSPVSPGRRRRGTTPRGPERGEPAGPRREGGPGHSGGPAAAATLDASRALPVDRPSCGGRRGRTRGARRVPARVSPPPFLRLPVLPPLPARRGAGGMSSPLPPSRGRGGGGRGVSRGRVRRCSSASAFPRRVRPPGRGFPRGASPRPAPSSRLRTGADQGNPTV